MTPSGNKILVVPDYTREALIINQINELGSYEVFSGSDFYTAFSSKLSPFEKPSLRADQDQIISVVGQNKTVWITPGMDIGNTILTQRHGQALWRTFLIVAIILFMIESYLSRPRPDAIKTKP